MMDKLLAHIPEGWTVTIQAMGLEPHYIAIYQKNMILVGKGRFKTEDEAIEIIRNAVEKWLTR